MVNIINAPDAKDVYAVGKTRKVPGEEQQPIEEWLGTLRTPELAVFFIQKLQTVTDPDAELTYEMREP